MSASNSPTIEELTKELELTRNELTKFEKKVADLTEDRDNVEAERDSFKHQLTVMKTDRDNWKKIAEAKEKDLDHLKVHYDCCVSDRDTYNNKVTNLTTEVGKLKKELESLEALNKLNADASKQYAEELNTLREQHRTLDLARKVSDENHKESINQYATHNKNLAIEVEKLKKELEEMTSLNDLNFNEVNLQVEKVRNLTEERRSLATTVSQLEKRLADANEDWQNIIRNSVEWQDKAERLESYTAQLESDYRETCATLRESVKAITTVASKLK